MTIDLNMIPIDEGMRSLVKTSGRIVPRTILGWSSGTYSIFSQLRRFEDCPAPTVDTWLLPDRVRLWVDHEEGGRDTKVDGTFGEPLTFVTALQLQGERFKVDDDPQHRAVKAYLDALPPQTTIILYWH
jgi:hypothetical protein